MADEGNVEKTAKLLSMEEAKANVSEDMKKRLGDIWEKGLLIANKAEAHLQKNNKDMFLGRPSEKLRDAINNQLKNTNKLLNEDVSKIIQNVTIERGWHTRKKHGNGREKLENQIPVTKETFMLIPDVLENFDSVKIGRDTWEGTIRKPSVTISKHYSDGTVVVADAIIDENTLKIKTMWIEKPTGVRPTSA